MANAHRKLHDQLRQPVNGKEFATPTAMASEATAAHDLITAAIGTPPAAKPAATKPESSALDRIIARHAAENETAVAIAIKTPEVKATLDAEAARANAKPDASLEAILARQAETRAFEERLLATNPVAANHDALAAIADRNR